MDEEPAMNRSDKAPPLISPTRAPHVHLTPKEREALHWSMLGKTAWETSRIQDCSEAAINFHLCNIRRKFGVCNMRAAVVKAIEQGVVQLD
ncbi:helix-turn-helix domain-containing protein [Pseudomonas alliivorans]|nr:helix-turn-helix domain-containing protein [Pseudomonas alliivorans]MEE4917396.1 helix-turn-helix domain-containing protein [Pseudomonas alliivorans]MEE4967959.1 helix-turn-helix domain-containing protein [Pseudomonas alliivorans]MEE4989598.1 helix-turn-helix domain-containing protein [Pseudomonas alliivorans]MEE4994819.1 helix-turn-helix domain-containing protein [Pseudomonas alliivorans]